MSMRAWEGFGRTQFCATGSTELAFTRVLKAMLPWIRRVAYRLSRDPAAREDLIQEGCIGLWMLDVTRFDLTDSDEVKYLRGSVRNRMKDIALAERARSRPVARECRECALFPCRPARKLACRVACAA